MHGRNAYILARLRIPVGYEERIDFLVELLRRFVRNFRDAGIGPGGDGTLTKPTEMTSRRASFFFVSSSSPACGHRYSTAGGRRRDSNKIVHRRLGALIRALRRSELIGFTHGVQSRRIILLLLPEDQIRSMTLGDADALERFE